MRSFNVSSFESGLSPSPLGYLGFLVNEKQPDAGITRAGAPCRKLPSIGEWKRACTAGSWRAIGARAALEWREGPLRRQANVWQKRGAANADVNPSSR